jgi:hypothetical protein
MTGSQKTKPRMQATLIRFSPDILEAVRAEARASGVSVAQFVREATLARVAYMAGRRGDAVYEAALQEAAHNGAAPASRDGHGAEQQRLHSENAALRAQAKIAARHAQQLKADAQASREPRR